MAYFSGQHLMMMLMMMKMNVKNTKTDKIFTNNCSNTEENTQFNLLSAPGSCIKLTSWTILASAGEYSVVYSSSLTTRGILQFTSIMNIRRRKFVLKENTSISVNYNAMT